MSDHDLISFHRKLLNAPERMQQYQKAIHDTVKPGDVVLDLGCGSGILGLFACQAGAARVYAVERSAAIMLAKELAKANGYADRIVYLNQDIKDAEIPEQVDVIVSELISKGVLGQKMSEAIGWCRDNLLKTGGRILPKEVDLYVAPVENAELYRKTVLPEKVTYGLDFTPVCRRSASTPLSCRLPPESLLTAAQVAYHYDAYTAGITDHFEAKCVFTAEKAGVVHGFALWFSSVLADGHILANAPPGIAAWDNLVLPLEKPVELSVGDVIELSLVGRDDSKMPFLWVWNTTVKNNCEIVSEQKQSSFNAKLPQTD
jgi:protein arginine N-methyltransferase 1